MNSSEITYSNDIKVLDKLSLAGFFVGWPNPPSDKTLERLLKNSQHIWLAIKGGELIGFINAISDQVLSAYIPLLEVLPEYQGQGIGQVLVKKIREDLQKYYMIDICCDEDVLPFYEKQGFKKGHSVMIRNYKNQSGNS
jgi:GNAT superfamily N-acetyltransferase